MIPITVCNHKGGSGKTTSTLMLASAIGLSGSRVLVIDLDPQGFLSRMVGVLEPEPERSSHIVFSEEPFEGDLPVVKVASFDLLASCSRLSAEIRRLNRPIDVLWLKEFIEARPGLYDYVFIDTAAALTVFSLNALVASRHVVIPVVPEYQPIVGAEQTYQTAGMVRRKLNPGLSEPRFLLTMVDGRKNNHHAYRQYLRDRYGESVLRSIVRTSASLSTTRHDGLTAFDFDPRGRGSVDYANVADELLAVIGAAPANS